MVTKRADQVDDPVAISDKVATALLCLREKHEDLLREKWEIKRLGIVEATPYYRDGKYLYLIYPMVNGERKREYIGGDPEKIQDALDKIERKDRYNQVCSLLAEIEITESKVRNHLINALSTAYQVKW